MNKSLGIKLLLGESYLWFLPDNTRKQECGKCKLHQATALPPQPNPPYPHPRENGEQVLKVNYGISVCR